VLSDKANTVTQLHAASHSADSFVMQRQEVFDLAADDYARDRLPFLLYVRARWIGSHAFVRAMQIMLGPLIVSAWFLIQLIDRVRLRPVTPASNRKQAGARLSNAKLGG
jgi:hypothetical protein